MDWSNPVPAVARADLACPVLVCPVLNFSMPCPCPWPLDRTCHAPRLGRAGARPLMIERVLHKYRAFLHGGWAVAPSTDRRRGRTQGHARIAGPRRRSPAIRPASLNGRSLRTVPCRRPALTRPMPCRQPDASAREAVRSEAGPRRWQRPRAGKLFGACFRPLLDVERLLCALCQKGAEKDLAQGELKACGKCFRRRSHLYGTPARTRPPDRTRPLPAARPVPRASLT